MSKQQILEDLDTFSNSLDAILEDDDDWAIGRLITYFAAVHSSVLQKVN